MKMCNYRGLHQRNDRSERINYGGISLVAHAGQMLPEIVASLLSNYCGAREIFPEEQCSFRTINIRQCVPRVPIARTRKREEN